MRHTKRDRARARAPAIVGLVLLATVVSIVGCDRDDGKVGALIPSFASELLKIREEAAKKYKLSAEDVADLEIAQQEIDSALPEPGLEIGAKAPDFTLKNAAGEDVTLSKHLATGPVILTFYRGAWCPVCNLQLRLLQRTLPAIDTHNATVIAVSPQEPEHSRDQIEANSLDFDVVSDLDNSVIKAYGLYYDVPEKMRDVYLRSYKLDFAEFNGEGRYGLPVPGTFVIDADGIVRSAYASTDAEVRAEPEDLLKDLEKLSSMKS